jgi:multiple sugar transport system substrate-binding protein
MKTTRFSCKVMKAVNIVVILMVAVSQLGWGLSRVAAGSPNTPVITKGDSTSVTASEVSPFSLHVRAYIDGESRLIVKGDTITWRHLGADAPGRNGGHNYPTYINGAAWYPTWPDVPDAANRDCDCFSSTLPGVSPALPVQAVNYALNIIQARDQVSIVQQPRAFNDYTFIIDFNDLPSGGAEWYEIEVIPTGNFIWEGDSVSVAMSRNGSPFPFDLTLHASDPDGDTLTWSISTPAGHGTATASETGESKAIGYLPDTDYTGSDAFVVQVDDGNGSTDTITVNVTVNNPPWIAANPDGYWVNGRGWPNGTDVQMTVERPAGTITYTAYANVGPASWDPTDIVAQFNLGDPRYDLKAGDVITLASGGVSAKMTVAAIDVTGVNALANTVSGTANAADGDVHVWVYDGPGATGSVAGGHWTVNFSPFDLTPGMSGFAQQFDSNGNNTQANWRVQRPWIEANVNSKWVQAREWPLGAALTMTINGSGHYTAIEGPTPWDPGDIFDTFVQFENISFHSGDVILITDGTTPKSYTVTNLQVTGFDVDADTVSGLATPGAQVQVCANVPGNCVSRYVTAAVDTGIWTADYGHPGVRGDEQQLVDLQLGSNGWASEPNGVGDQTWVDWNVPDPNVEVSITNSRVQGRQWPMGDLITLTIDDPSNGPGVDYTATTTFGQNPENPDPSDQIALFKLNGLFDLKAGDIVTLSDGPIIRTTTVTSLVISAVNPALDTVSGTAAVGTEVHVWVNASGAGVNRWVTADGGGNWIASFATAGPGDDEKVIFDIVPGTNGGAQQFDNQGHTWADWRVLKPYIEANTYSNWANAREWPNGTLLTLTIDDPTNGPGIDKTVTATMGPAPWNPGDPNDIVAVFNLNGFDLKSGQILKVTDGATPPNERTYTLSNIAVTGINPNADTVSGIATPGVEVQVCANVPGNCISRYVTAAAGTGAWTADYGHPGARSDEQQLVDLQPGSNGWAAERDENGDQTQTDWRVLKPYIEASPRNNWVHGREWPIGTLLTLTIDDPTNGVGVDLTVQATMVQAPWNPGDPNDIVADFNLGGFDVKAGQLLKITDGATPPSERTYTLSDLAITGFDTDADTVSGIATPGVEVQVCANVPGNCISRYVTPAAGTGIWTADYGHPGARSDEQQLVDLQRGSNGWATERDATGNQTWADWNVPNPRFDAWFKDGNINAYDWALGTTLTLDIDDPATPTSPDFTTTTVVGIAPWDSNQTLGAFNLNGAYGIEPGMTVTVSGASVTKSLVVSHLTITDIDQAHDAITGTTEPGQGMWMYLNTSSGTCCRNFQADSSGIWTVDYSVVGPGGEPIEDIRPGSTGTINASNGYGDNTSLNWTAFKPRSAYLKASAANDWVHAYGWQDGQTLTLEVVRPSHGAGVDYTTTTTAGPAPWDSNSPVLDIVGVFDLGGVYDLQPNDVLTVSGAGQTETYTVPASMAQVRWFIGLGGGSDPAQIPTEQEVLDDYNLSHTNSELIQEVVPNANDKAKKILQDEISAGNGPDIVGPVGWMGANTLHGQWADLAPLIAANHFNTGIFTPALMNMYKTNEGQVALPFAIYPSAIYYNPALFTAAGLHYPPAHYGDKYIMPNGTQVVWSWQTVAQVSKLLTLDAAGKNATQTGFDPNNIVQYGFSFGWENHPSYWGSFWKGGTILQPGVDPGTYAASIPSAWKDAWQWVYDGIWGAQPYIPNGTVSGSADFDAGNVFASGKIAMLDNPLWYTCCINDLINAGGKFQFGAMPSYNGKVGGRIDNDTFRIVQGTTHPNEAFMALAYLVTTGVDKLIIGTPDTPAAYGAIPAIPGKQQPFWAAKAKQYPFVTPASWNILKAGLNYPDVPNAESYMPNINAAWNRIQTFGNLLGNTAGLSLPTEEATLESDLEIIFNKGLITVPTLILPTDGFSLLNRRPTFDWSDVTNPINYTIQISKNPTFTQLVANVTGIPSTYTPAADLPANITLYWRVRAKFSNGYGAWSAYFTLDTPTPPSVPVLVAPANNALTTNYTPLLDWANSTVPVGAPAFDHYLLQVSPDSGFPDGPATLEYTTTVGSTANSQVVTDELSSNTIYYWRVRSENVLDEYSAWSAVRTLRTAILPPNTLLPGNPVPGVADNVLTRRPTFTWEAVSGASGYTVEVSKTQTFAVKAINASSTATSYTHTADLAANTVYFWRVKANGANGPSLYSQVRTFTTGNPPSVPALTAPANNALVISYTPLLDWSNSSLPATTIFSYYQVQVATDLAFSSPILNDTSRTSLTDSKLTTPTLDPNTKFYWRVRAINTVGGVENYSAWSAVRTFRTKLSAPVAISPVGGVTVGSLKPAFDWQDVPGATGYAIQVSRNTAFSSLVVNKTISTATSTYIPTTNLPAGTTLYWRVRANGANGPSDWMAYERFTTP